MSLRVSRRFPVSRFPQAARAFTLLELLIATAVGGIVLLTIQTVFFSALRLQTTTHSRVDADVTLHRALSVIRRDFAGLALPGSMLAGQLQTESFSSSLSDSFGERVGPDLYTTSGRIDGWSTLGDLQRVTFYLGAPTDGRRNGKDLIRAVQRNLLPIQETAGEPQVLLRGVLEAAIEFCDGSGWTDTWDSEATSTLPTALKFRLVLAPEEGRTAGEPVELIVPVMVQTSESAALAAAEASGL